MLGHVARYGTVGSAKHYAGTRVYFVVKGIGVVSTWKGAWTLAENFLYLR
jgi:hypothetical protein